MNTRHSRFSLTAAPPSQAVGRVADALPEGFFIVEHEQRGWQCRQAASCLLQPQTGDLVLIAGNGAQLWLLAVLERTDAGLPYTLDVPGPLRIAPQGDLTLATPAALSLDSRELAIDSGRGDCRIKELAYQGRSLSAWISRCTLAGKSLETVWQTTVSISQRLLRKVTHTEHVRVGQWDCQAEDYARLHGKHLLMTSEAIAKLDAEQIHVG
ncbi:DUF3540 domain-containing protein [Martelella alba]|uniref:DUF3540 domain-containing protein n=1 Tax=Martelella alba TaxID=2590451 RepID=A0ABY2SIG9_9HYPH|nr:DUF3540 domain-containing protein [Martelella alba]TKI04339.1 DUF3540 domain-containing protein [Martelella alba]